MMVTEKIGTLDTYDLDGMGIVQLMLRLQGILDDAKAKGYTNLTVKEESRYYSEDRDLVIYGEREETSAEMARRAKKEAKEAEKAAKKAVKEREAAKKRKAMAAILEDAMRKKEDRKKLFEELQKEFAGQ